MTRHVNASWERRGKGHVSGRSLAVSGSRGDGRTRPYSAYGAVEVLWVGGCCPLRSRASSCSVTARVVVTMAGDVDVDGQPVEVVDVVLVTRSTVCVQSVISHIMRIFIHQANMVDNKQ